MMALVDAMAGMMRLTTPWVSCHVTPAMLYFSARWRAVSNSHWMCSGSSLSSFLSESGGSPRTSQRGCWRGETTAFKAGIVGGEPRNSPLNTRGHSRMLAHSMQCSGSRGVLAMVQIGKAVGGVSMSSEHS
jgi:hypothetical protein